MIVGVEKGAIAYHYGHLIALMHNLKVTVHIEWSNFYLLIVLR